LLLRSRTGVTTTEPGPHPHRGHRAHG
jgi:hypothetical protein